MTGCQYYCLYFDAKKGKENTFFSERTTENGEGQIWRSNFEIIHEEKGQGMDSKLLN